MSMSPDEALFQRRVHTYNTTDLSTVDRRNLRRKRRFMVISNDRYLDALRTEVFNGHQPFRLAT